PLTRLARSHNTTGRSSGRTMSGGLDANALAKPKALFGAARAVPNGGSLTVVATALIETESRMDDVIFEEFKGTGNAELRLARELADRRIYPAVDNAASGTRREELLADPATVEAKQKLRRGLVGLPPEKAVDVLLAQLRVSRRHAVERGAEVRVLLADHDDRVLPVAADHVAVQVGHYVGEGDRRVLREELAAPEAALFAAHGHEGERAPGMGRELREGRGGLDHGGGSRRVVVGAVTDRVRALGDAAFPHPGRPNVIHVSSEEDVLALELGVTPLQDPDHVGR